MRIDKAVNQVDCFALNHQLCWCDPKRFERPGAKRYKENIEI